MATVFRSDVDRTMQATDWDRFYREHSFEPIVIEDSPTPPSDRRTQTRKRRLPSPPWRVGRPAKAPALPRPYDTTINGRSDTHKRQKRQSTGYIPPRTPIIKSKDVFVPCIADHTPNAYKAASKYDDEEGHYIIVPDSDITPRYQIVRLLGQGTFGKVVMAFDRNSGSYCAIKIIRAVQKYRDASKIELRVLTTLGKNDPPNRNKCIHLRECFDWRNHICIVTDLLGMNVFDFLKANSFIGFPMSHIQSFAKQLFRSVAFLHDLHLIHTDLKPENILLVKDEFRLVQSPRAANKTSRVLLDTNIRLIDFGSATFEDEYHSSIVSTRHYRAPEIILNLGWSFACDIWSIGCILVELFTGDALFQTHDNLEHLAMMEVICGRNIGPEIIRIVRKDAKDYFRQGQLNYPNESTSKQSRRFVKAMKPLTTIIQPHLRIHEYFLDLLKRIFVYDPSKRITAKEALMHPFFSHFIHDEGANLHLHPIASQ